MKLIKRILTIVGIVIVIFFIFLILFLIKLKLNTIPPAVPKNEKESVTKLAENYLTNKYGNHNFKVKDVDYIFQMDSIFDYSNCTGYSLTFNSDVVDESSIDILGTNPNEYVVKSDSFIVDYYFLDLDGYERYEAKESMIPKEAINKELYYKIKQEFDSNCQNLECYGISLNIPEDFGRIPSLEELKNEVKFYEILNFQYTINEIVENEEDYKNQLRDYLSDILGGDWDIYYLDGKIECFRQ